MSQNISSLLHCLFGFRDAGHHKSNILLIRFEAGDCIIGLEPYTVRFWRRKAQCTRHEQIALLQSMLMQSMRGGHPGASSSHPLPPPPPPPPPTRPRSRLRPPPPPRPSHQETLTPPTVVPTPALDADDVYRPRMYEPEDEKETNLPLQQEWIDALSDTHPLPRPDRDN
ncbi:hypothetical protein Sjap_002201 [Stephania japonica]|uniref:Uncharacterized protein n=1 Tax=Stephania japonica TaxID=461633 RepID=A0AAP0PVW4_9MAGN